MRASGLFGKVEHDGVSCSPMWCQDRGARRFVLDAGVGIFESLHE